MGSLFPKLTSEVEASITEAAVQIHRSWLTIQAFFGEDRDWLASQLCQHIKGELSPDHIECLRMALAEIEMRLSVEDRKHLRAMADELRQRPTPLPLSDPKFYRELDQLIVDRFPGRPMTFIRLQRLSLQLTNYLVGFGDIK